MMPLLESSAPELLPGPIPPERNDTSQKVAESLAALADRLAQVESLNHELQLQLQARSSESQTDGLTGLANRRSFDYEFNKRCQTARHSRCPLILVLLDVDHFKAVNDTRGHHVGDAVLRGLAGVLRDNLPPGVLLARFGGEEFALILSGLSIDDAIEVVEQLRLSVRHTQFRHEGQRLSVTISCGLADLGAQDYCEHVIQRADAALYASKQAGRNRTSWENGNQLHLASSDDRFNSARTEAEGAQQAIPVVDLCSRETSIDTSLADLGMQSSSVLMCRTTRANWCDGSMLFWYLRQRLAEWKLGGDPFCILAIDVDDSRQIALSYGLGALHFMMRAQMLHLDASLQDMDIVARTSNSKVMVILPRTTLSSVKPCLNRLRKSMDRFAYPVASGLIDYSISVGIAEADLQDDAQQLVNSAEAALGAAQRHGTARFFVHDRSQGKNFEIDIESAG